MSKLILVTGGAGFIGTALCARLQKEGHSVISLDNYFTGSRENHVPGVEYREGHTKDIEQLVPETPDLIYHLGEYSRIAKSLEEPELVWDLNMAGTLGVLEFWRAKKCNLIYAGSSTKQAETRHDGVEGRDLSPYTWAKAANSDLVNDYARWYDLPAAITYFYNVYGEGERSGVAGYGTFIETVLQKYRTGEAVDVRGPGTQTRAFTHIDDTVEALVLVGERGMGGEYGISAKEVYSLLEVVNLFGVSANILPPTPSTRSTGATDTAKLEALGWKQQQNLESYIETVKNKGKTA